MSISSTRPYGAPPSTPEKKKPRRKQEETMDEEMDAFFMDIPSPMLDSPTLLTKKGKVASLSTEPNYSLTPPPELRGNVLFSAVKPRHPQLEAADLNEHDDHDESSPPRQYVDDEGLKTWDNATSSASAMSSSEPDSMMLSTPPQPERVRKMDDLPQKVQNQPRLADVLSTPESPAPKYGASGTPFLRMGDALH